MKKIMPFIITGIVSLCVGLILAFSTNLIYKPKVIWEAQSYNIELPEEIREEIRQKEMETFIEGINNLAKDKSLNFYQLGASIKPTIQKNNSGKFEKSISLAKKLDKDTMNRLFKFVNDRELLKKMFSTVKWYPDTVLYLQFKNIGNKQACDVNVVVTTNGVITKYEVDSDEPTAKEFNLIKDKDIGLPTGLNISNVKRLVPKGYINVKLYLQHLESTDTSKDTTTITVYGTHSEGKIIHKIN